MAVIAVIAVVAVVAVVAGAGGIAAVEPECPHGVAFGHERDKAVLGGGAVVVGLAKRGPGSAVIERAGQHDIVGVDIGARGLGPVSDQGALPRGQGWECRPSWP